MIGVLIARAGRFVTTVGRHVVPLGGVFGRDWHPATAIGVYWLESMMLALAAAGLCALMQRRTSPTAIEEARLAGDLEGVRSLAAERVEFDAANIQPRDVLLLHVASLLVFGIFLASVVWMLI